MIDPHADPINHRSPYKRIEVAGKRRPTKPVITRQEIEDNLEPMPNPEFYVLDHLSDNWILKP
jgi:hypothetical protein